MSDNYEYGTRKNGEVEILRDGSVARLLREGEAQDFLAQVKDGDAQQVMARFVDAQPQTSAPPGADAPAALQERLDGPTPHGDGTVREKDGQARPTD